MPTNPELVPGIAAGGRSRGETGEAIEHCYFPDSGRISLLITMEDIEAGVIGKEGFADPAALMGFGVAAPNTGMVQMEGFGLRIASKILRGEMIGRPALLDRVQRFSQVLNTQIAQIAWG